MTTAEKKYYTVLELAELLNVSDETIYRRLRSGALKSVKFGNQWRVSAKQLEEYLEGR